METLADLTSQTAFIALLMGAIGMSVALFVAVMREQVRGLIRVTAPGGDSYPVPAARGSAGSPAPGGAMKGWLTRRIRRRRSISILSR